MLKLTLAMACLLMGASALKSRSSIPDGAPALTGTQINSTVITAPTYTVNFDPNTTQSVLEFWENRTDGELCFSLFQRYINLTTLI
jgi:hypothetical protein